MMRCVCAQTCSSVEAETEGVVPGLISSMCSLSDSDALLLHDC